MDFVQYLDLIPVASPPPLPPPPHTCQPSTHPSPCLAKTTHSYQPSFLGCSFIIAFSCPFTAPILLLYLHPSLSFLFLITISGSASLLLLAPFLFLAFVVVFCGSIVLYLFPHTCHAFSFSFLSCLHLGHAFLPVASFFPLLSSLSLFH